ncbi:MAG: hypothetical protein ISR96_08700 [Nitrospira sp.]|nr:hypothetical protein [bacterium]MBL7049578.1 hypothetical protein [Nitrospira sp.]
MKKTSFMEIHKGAALILITAIFMLCTYTGTANADFRNFYGLTWKGIPGQNVKFAKQMGYKYIGFQYGMQHLEIANGLRFYLDNPEYHVSPVYRYLDYEESYSSSDAMVYESLFTIKDDSAEFPYNIANGWWESDTKFGLLFDWQQQPIIDMVIERIILKIKFLENRDNDFQVGGIIWDVARLTGDFWTARGSNNGKPVTLTDWTGHDSCASTTHVHDYETYSDGHAAYLKQLYTALRAEFPGIKFIMEPYRIYGDWIRTMDERDDAAELMPDMLVQEDGSAGFADDDRITASGLITNNYIGTSSPEVLTEYDNRHYAAKAGINGSWFNWYGRFGGTEGVPAYDHIHEVPPRMQLIRVLPNWDNMTNVPLSERSWDGVAYQSSNSYADTDVIYSRHPETGKIFAVFLNTSGEIMLQENEEVTDVQRADGLFRESGSGMDDIIVENSSIYLNDENRTAQGYIITTTISRPLPPVIRIVVK